MAITISRFATGQLQNNNFTGTISLGTIADNDVVVVGVYSVSGIMSLAISDSIDGNAWSTDASISDGTYGCGKLFSKKFVTGAALTITLTYGLQYGIALAAGAVLTGADPTATATANPTTAYGTHQQGSSIAIGDDGSYSIAFFGGSSYPGSNDPGTPDNSWTPNRCSGTDQTVQSIDKILNVADSPVTPGIVYAFNQYGICLQAVYKPSGGGGGFDPATSLIPWSLPDPVRTRYGLLPAVRSGSFFGPPPLPNTLTIPRTDVAYRSAVPRPRFHASQQRAFSMPELPDTRTVPHSAATFPDRSVRPRMPASEQQATARSPIDRITPYADGIEPDWIARRFMPASEQQAAASLPPQPEQTLPEPSVTAPARVVRPAMLAAEQLATPIRQWPLERAAPYADGIAPDSVRRPFLHASEQQGPASLQSFPDARMVPWSDATAPATVRRPMEHASEQQALIDPTDGWALVAAVPSITPAVLPDAVRRPSMHGSLQRGPSEPVPIDRPFPQVDGVHPASVRRPAMPPEEQQASAAPGWPPDARTVPWSDAVAPSAITRPLPQASQQRAFTVTTTTDRNVPLADSVFPAFINRWLFGAFDQQAFTGLGDPIPTAPVPDLVCACYPHSVSAVVRDVGLYSYLCLVEGFSLPALRAYARALDHGFPVTGASDHGFPSSNASGRLGAHSRIGDE